MPIITTTEKAGYDTIVNEGVRNIATEIDADGSTITNVLNPSSPNDGATKDYTDNIASPSSTLVTGGIITQNTPTSVDISAGSGRIVTVDGLGNGSVTEVTWTAKINVAIIDILTTESTRFYIDGTGSVVQQPSQLDTSSIRLNITLGFVVHPSGTIGAIVNDSLKAETLYSQFIDHLEVLGVTRKSGLTITADTGLSLSKSSGSLESPGAGIGSGNIGQNIIDINAVPTAAPFARLLASTGTVESASVTVIDPGFYDDGSGTKVALPQMNDASIIYIYQSVDATTGGLIVAYGQTVYDNLSSAEINKDTDLMTLPEDIKNRTNLIARIAVAAKATDLTQVTEAVFFPGVKFGTSISGGSISSGTSGGDVSGPASSIINEIPAYADATGKLLVATSDVTIDAGKISRVTAGESLWLNVDSAAEHVILGQNDALTGVGNPTNITAAITASGPNGLAFVTSGNNSQYIEFVKSGTSRGAVFNNRDRNSVGISSGTNANSNTIYIETLNNNTSTMMVDKIGIGKTASADDMVVDIADGMGGFKLSNHTTVQRDALTVSIGAKIWNTTTGIAETWDGSVWQQSVQKSDIVDNLTSTDTDKPLSANQGRVLQARTVQAGFFFSTAVQNLVPNVQQTISWLATAFMGKQNPITNGGSSTTLTLDRPGKYEITINVVLQDKNATPINSVVNLEVDSNITSTVLYRDSLRTNESFTVGATTSHHSSFLLDVQSPTDSHILRCKLTLVATSGTFDVLTSTYFKAVKYE